MMIIMHCNDDDDDHYTRAAAYVDGVRFIWMAWSKYE